MTTILFQGDSITDAGRGKHEECASRGNDPHALGNGYAARVAGVLLSSPEAANYTVYNRGISGNRITGLLDRWNKDCIHLQPDILSILIGVNDIWHQEKSDTGVETDRFAELFEHLLKHTKKRLPEVKLLMCQPFMFPAEGIGAHWPALIVERAAICRQLAKQFDAVWVPFGDDLSQAGDHNILVPDGVHPGPGGAEVMSATWLSAARAAGLLPAQA
jgi:lysophospholipase L1-like esterase